MADRLASVGVAARFLDEPTFAQDRVRLIIRDRDWGEIRYLASDGTWSTATATPLSFNVDDPPAGQPIPMGIDLPREAVEAIAEACEIFLGHASHGATEAKVLREALDVERARVDRMLEVRHG